MQEIIKNLNNLYNNKQFKDVIADSNKFLRFKDCKTSKKNNNFFKVYNFRALSYFNLKKFYLSKKSYEKSIHLNADENVLYNYAYLLFVLKDFNLCLNAIEKVINKNQQNLEVFLLLKRLIPCLSFENKKIADELFFKAININTEKKDINELIKFINFLSKNNELKISKFLCEKLLKKNNHVVFFLYYLIQKKLSNYKIALKYILKAIELDNQNYLYYHEIGSLHEILGDIEKAKESFKKSLILNTNFGSTYRSLANLNALHSGNIDTLEKKIIINNDKNFLMHANYALSKYYFDNNNHEKCYELYRKANSIRKENVRFSKKYYQNYLDFLKKNINNFFSKDFLTKIKKKAPTPIFIIGLPRSGSSLVEQILNSHSKISSFGEVSYFYNSIDEHYALNQYIQENKIASFIDIELSNKISKSYYEKFYLDNNEEYFSDKMLFNFYYIDLIKKIIPESKIIICSRDLRDIFMSIIRNYFTDLNFNFAYDENDLFDFLEIFSKHMIYCKEKYEDIYFIKYEELVLNTNFKIRDLLKYLNLEFEENCINFNKNKSFVATASSSQVRKKIYSSSVNLWSNYEKFYKETFQKLDKLNKLF